MCEALVHLTQPRNIEDRSRCPDLDQHPAVWSVEKLEPWQWMVCCVPLWGVSHLLNMALFVYAFFPPKLPCSLTSCIHWWLCYSWAYITNQQKKLQFISFLSHTVNFGTYLSLCDTREIAILMWNDLYLRCVCVCVWCCINIIGQVQQILSVISTGHSDKMVWWISEASGSRHVYLCIKVSRYGCEFKVDVLVCVFCECDYVH